MKIGDQCETSQWSGLSVCGMTLIRIIVGEQAVAGAIGIITEPQMPSGDVGKGLDVFMNAGYLQPTQQHLALRLSDFGLRPVAGIRKVLPHMRTNLVADSNSLAASPLETDYIPRPDQKFSTTRTGVR